MASSKQRFPSFLESPDRTIIIGYIPPSSNIEVSLGDYVMGNLIWSGPTNYNREYASPAEFHSSLSDSQSYYTSEVLKEEFITNLADFH